MTFVGQAIRVANLQKLATYLARDDVWLIPEPKVTALRKYFPWIIDRKWNDAIEEFGATGTMPSKLGHALLEHEAYAVRHATPWKPTRKEHV